MRLAFHLDIATSSLAPLRAEASTEEVTFGSSIARLASPAPYIDLGEGGCIVGPLFRRELPATRVTNLNPAERQSIVETGGGALLADYIINTSRRTYHLELRATPATYMVEVASPNVLQAGSVVPAALITGIRSDLPGQITAQVTQNVYDSPTGRILLIPQGARLIGEYDSEIIAGQSRVLLAWDRLILPGGRSIALDRLPGADAAGMAGLADRTNYHWRHILKAALVSTLLGVGAELGDSSEDRVIRALRNGGQETMNETGRQIVERQLGIPPTLTIRPGFTLRVIVTRDIIFDPVAQEDNI